MRNFIHKETWNKKWKNKCTIVINHFKVFVLFDLNVCGTRAFWLRITGTAEYATGNGSFLLFYCTTLSSQLIFFFFVFSFVHLNSSRRYFFLLCFFCFRKCAHQQLVLCLSFRIAASTTCASSIVVVVFLRCSIRFICLLWVQCIHWFIIEFMVDLFHAKNVTEKQSDWTEKNDKRLTTKEAKARWKKHNRNLDVI